MKISALTHAAFLIYAVIDASAQEKTASSTAWQWRPQRGGKDLRLQDFCVFDYQGTTMIASMMKDFCNEGIALARSKDLTHWENLGTALPQRTAEDASMVWAPHVVQSKGVYYMFYTGVTTPVSGQWCQHILVASSATPDDPASWKRCSEAQFVVNGKAQNWFRPSHPGSVWTTNAWADCRDPMVLEKDGTWHLFYTGRDQGHGICGVATAPAVLGPWTDRGAVLHVPDPTIPESCYVLQAPDSSFVMTFNHAGGGSSSNIARSRSLLPLNGQPCFTNQEPLEQGAQPGLKGWAHEFLLRPGKPLLAAYLTGYYVTLEEARLVKESSGWTVAPAASPKGHQ
jgi:hypothetical protein